MKKIFIKSFAVVLIFMLSLFNVKYSFSDAGITYLKVGLNYGNSSVKSIEFNSEGGFEVGTLTTDNQFGILNEVSTNKIIVSREGNNLNILDGNGNEIMDIPFPDGWIEINPLDKVIKTGNKGYHGSILLNIKNSGSGINIINYVDLEQYLYGVVPKESSPSWNIEALKAQALAARTYAALNKGKYTAKYGFDVTNDTSSQVYGGALVEDARSNKAVDETRGQYIYYKDKLIDAVFFSCSGGRTDDAENVWGSSVPYLKSVDDSLEPKNIAKANWSKSYTSTELSNILTKNGVNIGGIIDIKANVASSGRVLTMTFKGTNGEKTLTRNKFMTIFGLDSNNFIVQKSSNMNAGNISNEINSSNENNSSNTSSSENEDVSNSPTSNAYNGTKVYVASSKGTYELKNANVYIKNKSEMIKNQIYGKTIKGKDNLVKNIPAKQETTTGTNTATVINTNTNINTNTSTSVDTTNVTFTIKGKGWGHGVGMSQWGAEGMAEAGKSYIEIIQHYYTGVEIK